MTAAGYGSKQAQVWCNLLGQVCQQTPGEDQII